MVPSTSAPACPKTGVPGWCGSRPFILVGVVHLNIIHRASVRAAAYQVNIAITVNPNYRVTDGQRDIRAAQPAVTRRLVHANVGNGHSVVRIHYVTADKSNVLCSGHGADAARGSGG